MSGEEWPTSTRVLYHCEGDEGGMLAALRAAFGKRALDVELYRWPEGERSAITDAVVWKPPADFFDGLTALERVHSLAAGVDHLLAHPGLPAAVEVIRLEDAGMAEPMAEYVLHGVLHAQRRFPELDAAARERRWARDIDIPSAAAFGVGILGAGVLARAVAVRLRANGYPVSCWSRTEKSLPDGIAAHTGRDGLERCLAGAHALVCLLPLTEATRDVLDAELFSRLPRGAYLVNPGRGEHLVEADLLAALDEGRLGGAMLDVFRTEPLPPGHPFWKDPRITVTPHVAAPTPTDTATAQVADNFAAIARGGTPSGRVDRERGY